jgi:polar amino acid transport system permease protein
MAYQLDFSDLLQPQYQEEIAHGILITAELIAYGAVFGVAVGIFGAWARTGRIAWLRAAVGAYVELIRNTPFLVQLFFVFFGLPSAGIHITEMQAAVLAMVINLGAYSTEIIRAGINAIPRGHVEAGLSLAMTRLQIFRHIILKPALQKIWPALSSQIVIVMLGSSVCSAIGVNELTAAAGFFQSRTFRSFEIYLVVTVIYLVLAILLRQLLRFGGQYLFGRRA